MTDLTWREIVPKIKKLTEPQVQALLDTEVVGQRRRTVMLRLHQRLSSLRMIRERKALLKGV